MESNFRDSLTGIFNEEYLKKNYQSYLDKHPDSNFIMIDSEKFKSINDTFGHNVGDDYLRTFAKILENNFKDSLVVRLHGDEFVILTKYSEDYIDEIFGENDPSDFDEETITTVNKFFENNLNVSETSRQLFVHRNTLVYRLEKLQKSTGLDVRTFDDALTFKIAMMVVNYMKYLDSLNY